ncbi:hypothetical protein Vadar_021892 [Vaccinium darrowii]|uniref:Uncharacterized protein n=1 Tax=Vaccinium darrowii TaxID=229202 RepID=A0ACB7YF03_9ERIC|nr:hypothetical protein Vadar_021892 [Vaccinium darrowii]
MSSPAEWYNTLPPITKAYGTICLLFTVVCQFGLHPVYIALTYEQVFKRLEVWRLFTCFFFLGHFSVNFAIRLLMIARYGVQLENGPFQRRTADFLWMMLFGAFTLLALSATPWLWSPFLGVSLVFMLLYVWSREFPDAQISFYGLVTLKASLFSLKRRVDLLGIIAGHLFYFLTVLHPLAGGTNILKTPMWVHILVRRWGIGAPAPTQAQADRNTGGVFRGRSHRLRG